MKSFSAKICSFCMGFGVREHRKTYLRWQNKIVRSIYMKKDGSVKIEDFLKDLTKGKPPCSFCNGKGVNIKPE